MSIKQHETTEKIIGENTFYILPFPAFTAANISGELASVLAPALAGLGGTSGDVSALDVDVSTFSGALSSLSGDKVEKLLKKLLINHGNVSIEFEERVQKLTKDIADEVFCGSAQDMFILAFEIIKVNFSGFFEKLGNQYGFRKITQTLEKTTPQDTENLTLRSSEN